MAELCKIGVKFSNMRKMKYLKRHSIQSIQRTSDLSKASTFFIDLIRDIVIEYAVSRILFGVILRNPINHTLLDYTIDEISIFNSMGEKYNHLPFDMKRFNKNMHILSQISKILINEDIIINRLNRNVKNIVIYDEIYNEKTILKLKNPNYIPINNEKITTIVYKDKLDDYLYVITDKKIDDEVLLAILNGSNAKIIGQISS